MHFWGKVILQDFFGVWLRVIIFEGVLKLLQANFTTLQLLHYAPLEQGGFWWGRCVRGAATCLRPTNHFGNLLFFKSNGLLLLQPLCIDDSRLASRETHCNTHVHKKNMIVRLNFSETPTRQFEENKYGRKTKINNQDPLASTTKTGWQKEFNNFSLAIILTFLSSFSSFFARRLFCRIPFAEG